MKKVDGARKPGKWELLYAARHARDLELCKLSGGHPRGLVWKPEEGERVVTFIQSFCKHHKGDWAGKPLMLELWQQEIIIQAFGWMRADGTRRYRTLYIEIPRKNGKSEVVAALGLYLTVADQEPGAEVYASATKLEQARIVWGTAKKMVEKSRKLSTYVKTFRSSLVVGKTDSLFAPLAADSKTLDGLNPHGNLVDELHAHKDRSVWDILDTAMGARRQPITIAITTAGTYDPQSIGWQMHEHATKVLEGSVEDDTFFAFIAAADEQPKDDKDPNYYFTEEIQRQANPNFGVSVYPSFVATQAEKAKRSADFLNEYLRLHLNMWTQQVTKWLSLQQWNECDPDVDGRDPRAYCLAQEALLERKACFGGLDLSSKLDLASFVLTFPLPGNVIATVSRFWLPEATINGYSKGGKPYFETWRKQGWITATPGNVIDYDFIRRDINTLGKQFGIQQIAFDSWNATGLSTSLMSDGFKMVECRQGYKTLSEPSKDLQARVLNGSTSEGKGTFRHLGHPVLRYCASNAVVTRDAAGNMKPDKEKASLHIDGVVAWVMSRALAIATPAGGENPYEQRGFRQL